MVSIAGLLPMEKARRVLPSCLRVRPNSVIAPSGCGMFIAPHRPGADDGYIMWAYGASAHRYPADVHALGGAELAEVVVGLTRHWHPALREMVRETPPKTVTAVPTRTSHPTGPWPTTNVTLLGDAIHSMTPLRGVGANMALNDAAILAAELSGLSGSSGPYGGGDLRTAVRRYEARMRREGFRAVAESLRAARMFVSESPLQRMMFKSALRVFSAVPSLRRALFARLG